MKNENPRGCKAPGFLINSFAFTLGAAPQTRLTFFITEKDPAGRTLQAAPCRPHPAGGLCKKLAPRAAVRRTNLFLYGHFITPYGRTSKMPLYSVKNKFYRRLQRGALNSNNTAKAMRKKAPYFMPFRASTRVSVGSMIFQI